MCLLSVALWIRAFKYGLYMILAKDARKELFE